jgi:hypothetical protein
MRMYRVPILALVLLVGASHNIARTSDSGVLWKFETGG